MALIDRAVESVDMVSPTAEYEGCHHPGCHPGGHLMCQPACVRVRKSVRKSVGKSVRKSVPKSVDKNFFLRFVTYDAHSVASE